MSAKLAQKLAQKCPGQSLAKPFLQIPGPKSFPLVGTLPHYITGRYSLKRLHISGRKRFDEFGKIVREEILPGVHLLYLFDPLDIEHLFRIEGRSPCRRSHTALEKFRIDSGLHKSAGLLPTNGDSWLKMRSSFQKALSKENVIKFIPAKDQVAQKLTQYLTENPNQFLNRDFLPYLMATFAEILGVCFFGTTFGRLESVEDKASVLNLVCSAAEGANAFVLSSDNGAQLWRLFETPGYRKFKQDITHLENIAREQIERISQTKIGIENRVDILSQWLSDESNDRRDVVTMSADMILAGIDTSSFSTSFLLYHLARNPEAQERVFQELKALLPPEPEMLNGPELGKTTELKRAIKESMRLSPVSVGVGRILAQDTEFSGYQVPKGTVVVTQGQVSSRLPQYFDYPDNFLPQRWDPQNRTQRPSPFLTLGFGHGPRGCIARRFAEQSIQIVTARILRNFYVEWTSEVELDSISVPINKPDSPLYFKFTRRPS